MWNYTSTSPHVFMEYCLIKYSYNFTFTLLPSEWEDEFGKGQHSVEFMGARSVKLQKGLKIREKIMLIVKVAIIAVVIVKQPLEVAIYVKNLSQETGVK
jgi:hypothetical protein